MKKKFSKILGVGLAVSLVLSLMVMATPASAVVDPVVDSLTVATPVSGLMTVTVVASDADGDLDKLNLDFGNSPPQILPLTFPMVPGEWIFSADTTDAIKDWTAGALTDAQEWGFVSATYVSVGTTGTWAIVVDTTRKWHVGDTQIPTGVPTDLMPGQEVWFDGDYTFTATVTDVLLATSTAKTATPIFNNDEEITPGLGLDAKGSEQRFWLNYIDVVNGDNVTDWLWAFTPGLNLDTWGAIASGFDVIVRDGGIPYRDSWGNPHFEVVAGDNVTDRYIDIWSRAPELGDCEIKVYTGILESPGVEVASAEKKWGELYDSVLDVDAATEAVEHEKWVITGIEETLSETVWCTFLEVLEPQEAGGAKVHWWLAIDDEDGLNQAWISGLMDDIVALGGAEGFRDAWSATGKYDPLVHPKDIIDEWIDPPLTVNDKYATETDLVDLNPMADPYVLSYIEPVEDWYGWNTTMDYIPGELPGVALAVVENDGDQEDVLIITLVEYQEDYSGQNLILIEIGKKHFGVPPPPAEVKTPQLRWAGEKIVLEKDGLTAEAQAIFTLEEGAVGSLESIYPADVTDSDARTVQTTVQADGVARAILISEQQGEADVNLTSGDINTGFLVYYLAFEDVVLAEDITPAASLIKPTPGVDTDVAVQVRGWFTSGSLPLAIDPDTGEVRAEKDGLPRGRYVLPDDWAALAGNNYALRPFFDLMDEAHHDSIVSDFERGPYDTAVKTTTPPSMAMSPSIGPFSTLQPWTAFEMWNAAATVPADFTVATPFTSPRTTADVRNTVVPDGSLDWYDAPMPQALVIFNVVSQVVFSPDTGSLSGLDKGDVEGYGYIPDPSASGTATGGTTTTLVDTTKAWTVGDLVGRTVCIVRAGVTYEKTITANTATSLTWVGALPTAVASGDAYYLKLYQSPFYEVEITSSSLITALGYNYDSWGVDGPYDYWTDLQILSISADTTEIIPVDATDVEVYSDNHGIAAVTIDALNQTGTVTITATAEFPNSLTKGKYAPRTSDEIRATWGPIELNPHFVADKSLVEVGEIVTFTNRTTGGTLPYVTADWDWGDGTAHGTTAVNRGDTITHIYTAPSVYSVVLTMTDSTPTTRWEERPNYITVTGEAVWDPMVYDVDDSGVIEKDEAVAAVNDYFDGEITKAQAVEVLVLYF